MTETVPMSLSPRQMTAKLPTSLVAEVGLESDLVVVSDRAGIGSFNDF